MAESHAGALLADYIANPEPYWRAPRLGWRQQHKLERCRKTLVPRFGADGVIGHVVDLAERRAVAASPPAVYVLGLGGSGSHWVGEMLAELPGFADAGEVSFPTPLVERLRPLEIAERELVIDGVHLLHALARDPDLAGESMVNSAGGSAVALRKELEPRCVVVYLARDPRNQVMSLVHRKPEYRKLAAPGLTDDEYLLRAAKWNRRNAEAVAGSAVPPDVVCRYEDLRADARPKLREIAEAAGAESPPDALETASEQHSADAMLAGRVPFRGNLHKSGTPGWGQLATERQRALLHAELRPVVERLGYPMDDCLGRRGEGTPLAADVEVVLPVGVGTLYMREADADSAWRVLASAAGTVVLPAGAVVKLCVDPWAKALAAALAPFPAGSLHGLCLNNVRVQPDVELSGLPLLDGLRELDISHTRAARAAAPWLGGLTGLTGVNVTGTKVPEPAGAATPQG